MFLQYMQWDTHKYNQKALRLAKERTQVMFIGTNALWSKMEKNTDKTTI